ncbi:MAG: hypothetical protein PVJ57_11120 [Phycisphaerae bacterium]|jgi:hypothetical protein
MIEVHSGTKPGRPRLLLLLCAGALAVALSLAWLQVHYSRQLGPEREVPGTPLRVRLPHRWVADPSEPGAFLLAARHQRGGRQHFDTERRIRFVYERWPAFEPPAEHLRMTASGGYEPVPTHIGRFPGVQLHQVILRRWGPRPQDLRKSETVQRMAWLPGGQLIKVIYTPMTDVTLADLRLLDDICATVRLDEPALNVTADEALTHTGVHFTVPPGSTVTLPYLIDVPGLFLSGNDNGVPAWSICVVRTWLAPQRTPRDLLLDFAAAVWLLPERAVEVREWQRPDGSAVATLRRPDDLQSQHPVASAWIVAPSPSTAVLLLVYTSEVHVQAASKAAGRIADEITIDPLPFFSDLAAAESAGTRLAGLLTAKGALPWWGERRHEMTFRRSDRPGNDEIKNTRETWSESGRYGYEGLRERFIGKSDNVSNRLRWEIDDRATAYASKETTILGQLNILTTNDRRDGGSAVQRVVQLNKSPLWSGTFTPGAAFVCPPVEVIAEAWVARQASGQWLLEVATPFGRASHSRLLTPLAPEDGAHRVLLLDDYDPLGTIRGFDDSDELLYWRKPTVRYDRVP